MNISTKSKKLASRNVPYSISIILIGLGMISVILLLGQKTTINAASGQEYNENGELVLSEAKENKGFLSNLIVSAKDVVNPIAHNSADKVEENGNNNEEGMGGSQSTTNDSQDNQTNQTSTSNTDPAATSTPLSTATPIPEPTSEPTSASDPTVEPTDEPTAEPEPTSHEASTSLSSSGGPISGAGGSVSIVYSDPTESGFIELSISGALRGLAPNRVYVVRVCAANCGTHNSPEILTDSDGNVDFSGVNFWWNQGNDPVQRVSVYQKSPDPSDSLACYQTTIGSTACLSNSISLN